MSACFECPPGTLCIPGRTIVDQYTGDAFRCVNCLRPTKVEVTYVIIIIETPRYRVVLGDDGKERFEPLSVMALAKQEGGKVMNTVGEWKKITSMFGGLNAGLGPAGFVTSGNISMDQLSGILQSQLDKGGSFTTGCFDDAIGQADQDAAQQGLPTSEDMQGISKERKKDKERRDKEVLSKEQMKEADEAGTPAVTGPIVACGNEGREKVFKIYDAAGRLIDTVTQDMLSMNPNIISEKLSLAQHFSDISVQLGGKGIADYVQRFTGLPVREMQSYAAQIQKYKSMADKAVSLTEQRKREKGKKRGDEPEEEVFPNDPLYQAPGEKKKKKLLGILGSAKKAAPITIGSTMKMGGGQTIGGGSDRGGSEEEIKDQWGLHEIGYTPWTDPDSAWNVVPATERNITVAVVDSGLDMGHPDAPEFIWTNPKEIPDNGVDDDGNGFVDDVHGWNFLTESHDFTDRRGHGTFVAGIIAAKTNNGIGIAGINPGAVIMPVVVADEEGETDSLAIFRGINYAVNHGARVINVSLGAPGVSKIEQLAIQRAYDMGALVVVAAGNTNDDIREFGPSSSKHVISVGQIDYSGERSTVSSQGANLALLAPGEKIWSLCSRDTKDIKPSIIEFGYYPQDGTSFATPMVSATASLIWAKNPDLSSDQVRQIILATATDMNDPGWDGMTGYGLLNAAAAMRAYADGSVTAMITNIRVNRDVRDKVISLDLYGSVRGDVREYFIEVGKGQRADDFKTIAGPLRGEKSYELIDRIDVAEHMRGSRHWILRLRVIGSDGEERVASTLFEMP